jgi:hypothetical protein
MPEETLMTSDALIEEINAAYRRLNTATENVARAERKVTVHSRRPHTFPSLRRFLLEIL